MIKRVTISILLQLILIPISYWILFRIAKSFHEPSVPKAGDFYGLTLINLSWFVVISIPVLNLIQTFLIRNEIVSILIHVGWLVFIICATIGDLHTRPFDYGLILFCIGLTIGTRLVINNLINLSTVKGQEN